MVLVEMTLMLSTTADTVDPTLLAQGRNTHIRLQSASYLGTRFTATALQPG